MPPLFLKLVACMLAAGVIAGGLLVIRQRQIDTVHEMAERHRRLRQQEQTLWEFQARIAERCRPERIRQAVDRLGGTWAPLVPVGSPPAPVNAPDPQIPSDQVDLAGPPPSPAPVVEWGG